MTGGCWSWIRKSGTVVTILVSRNRWWYRLQSVTVAQCCQVHRYPVPGLRHRSVCRIRTQSRYRKSLPLILSPDSRVLPDRRTLFLTQTTLKNAGFLPRRRLQTERLLLPGKSGVQRCSRICTVVSRSSAVTLWKRGLPGPLCHPL